MKNAAVAASLLVVALGPSIPRPSGACSPVAEDSGPHELDPAFSTDNAAPSAVGVTVNVYRSDSGGGAGCAQDTCGGGFNTVSLILDATDDRTPSERMGYRFTIVGGQPPPGFQLPNDDRSAYYDVNYRFDASFHGAFAFEVEVRAIDLNGNVGPATRVTIAD